jgi:dTMP kinase
MFVTFEGIDGAGKSTLIAGLAKHFEAANTPILITREPGAGALGAKIRELLLHGGDIVPEAELFLFLADRSQHVRAIIRPALAANITVLCDRYADSTVVYQGYGRDLDIPKLRDLNHTATGGLKPDLTFLLDLDIQASASRIQNADRLDQESMAFRERVRDGFLAEAGREPERWHILDATKSPGDLIAEAWARLSASNPTAHS